MDLEYRLGPHTEPDDAARQSRWAEELGCKSVWSAESDADPFLPLVPAATATSHIEIGTGVAIAYARSPFATAASAWYLHRISGGRMVLGLGTQVRAHVERRFGTTWHGAGKPLAEYVACCREIWRAFGEGDRPNFVGKWWQCTLLNPEFRPKPLPEGAGPIPVWIAAVGPGLLRAAGGVADGVNIHAFHTPAYLRDTLLPALDSARAKAGNNEPARLGCCVMAGVAHDAAQRAALREYFRGIIAFYGSTPTYRPILDSVGCGDLQPRLQELSRHGGWEKMARLVPDELVDAITVTGGPAELGAELRSRYEGLLTQVSLYRTGDRFMSEGDWATFAAAVRGG